MLECINKECLFKKERECKSSVADEKCVRRINPTYTEEKLNHAIEKENKCYNEKCQYNNKSGLCEVSNVGEYLLCEGKELERLKPINYEEEYHKLKKENEELKGEVKAKNMILKSAEELAQFEKENICKLQDEMNNSSVKITILEQEKKELEKANQGLAMESKQRYQTIRKLQRLIEDNTENATLRNKIEDLEGENDSLKLKAAVTEKLEIEINNLNEIIERKDKELDGERKGNTFLENENKSLKDRIEVIEKDLRVKVDCINESHEMLKKENNQLKFQLEELGGMVDEGEEEIKQLKKEKESHIKQIKDLVQKHNEEQTEKLLRQKENIDLKNAVKAIASLL